MGSPAPQQITPLEYAWGSVKPSFYDLPPKKQVEFWERLIAELKDHLSYFPAFVPVEEMCRPEKWSTLLYAEVPLPVKAPVGHFDLRTKCTNLLQFDASYGEETKLKKLLLTRNGRLILWRLQYQKRKTIAGNRGAFERTVWEAKVSEFEPVTDRLLKNLLRNASCATHIFWRLEAIAREAIEEREKRLDHMRTDIGAAKAALGRLDWADHG
jgi:hypothetical protein